MLQLRSVAAAGQDFALADMVGRADDAFGFHSLDDSCRPVVADLKVALYETG